MGALCISSPALAQPSDRHRVAPIMFIFESLIGKTCDKYDRMDTISLAPIATRMHQPNIKDTRGAHLSMRDAAVRRTP